MAKKILAGLGTLALVTLPLLALAQVPTQNLSNCCQMKHLNVGLGCEGTVGEYTVSSEVAVGGTCYSKGVAHVVLAADTITPDWGGCCTMDTVYTVTDWIFWIFLAFVVIMGVWTGFMFMTAGGDPGKIEKARGMIVYLVIGIIVAVVVKLIPALTRSIIGI